MRTDAGSFIADLRYEDLPRAVVEQARLCLLDLAGVAAAGTATDMSKIMRNHAVENFGSPTRAARLLFDGRRASPVGAAMAGAATIDSFDGHDGHDLTKGHTGAAVLPALLAFADSLPAPSGQEFLTALVVGYEIGTRAGIALHATSPDYHSSGAWNALPCAAIGARLQNLTRAQTQHALGIAEYHGPRSPMMRCIDHPTMVKDGSAWGAAAGVSSALLAEQGFTGAPAGTLIDADTGGIWDDLGQRWRITEQYLKPFPVCRWAHPAVQAVLDLRGRHHVLSTIVERIEVFTFHAATRLDVRQPTTTEEAQYSLPYAVATAFVHGTISPRHLMDLANPDDEVQRLSSGMVLIESASYEALFPADRQSHVHLVLRDGRRLESPITTAVGGPDNPLDAAAVTAKYSALTDGVLGSRRAAQLRDTICALPGAPTRDLLNQMLTRT